MSKERRRKGVFWNIVADDPYRKLVAVGLAVLLWFFINSRIMDSTDYVLPLRVVDALDVSSGENQLAIALPTDRVVKRRFLDEDREIPEERVKGMFEKLLSSPLVAEVAKVIESRLGRPLEPFDIWYNGFRPRGAYSEAELDTMVSKKYPTPEAYDRDIPNLLEKLGFSEKRASYLSDHIVVLQSARHVALALVL